MRYALVNGQRQEAQPGLSGECLGCNQPMIAKCGEIKIWHWAHRGKCTGDPWWENETEWHRHWKMKFPVDWQEIILRDKNSGEKHIADVKTDKDWVLEFQHSHIEPEERRSREAFYGKLVWIVDGVRLKRDKTQLLTALQKARQSGENAPLFKLKVTVEDCTLLRKWASKHAPVFFDFGDQMPLIGILPVGSDGVVYVVLLSHANFVELHGSGVLEYGFGEFMRDCSKLISERHRGQQVNQLPPGFYPKSTRPRQFGRRM